MTVVVKVGSHRARRKLYAALGELESFFSFDREGEFYRLAEEQAPVALAITGISRSRDGDDLLRHWPDRR